MNGDGDRGPARADATPPVDALATVVVDGDALTTAGVPAGDTVAVHARPDEGGDDLADYADADVPEPAGAEDVPDEATDAFEAWRRLWVTLVVEDERCARFTATEGSTVALHLEQAEGDISDPRTWDFDTETPGSSGETEGSA